MIHDVPEKEHESRDGYGMVNIFLFYVEGVAKEDEEEVTCSRDLQLVMHSAVRKD